MTIRTQRVVFETERNRITGDIRLVGEGYRSRLSDLLNQEGLVFISVTDAEISPIAGGQAEARPFLAVARSHIQLAYELPE